MRTIRLLAATSLAAIALAAYPAAHDAVLTLKRSGARTRPTRWTSPGIVGWTTTRSVSAWRSWSAPGRSS